MAQSFMTAEGYKQLVDELDQLRTVERDEIARKIKEARDFGDLSENAEYDEAMNEQAILEARIARLEEELKNAVLIDDSAVSTDQIGVGSVVEVFDRTYDEKMEFRIIGKSQADPAENRISDESPIGKALIGAKAGDVVEADTPGGIVVLEVVSISK
ncbi:MAG: transcription elongation factor GreA [Oscillospiraceae bacterium]|jgi:transcription elongation factor GreA|nr:transcription elongation factor GreA [Oscillospiraceae bacterium]